MAIRRYSLIIRHWLWLLIIVAGCAALLSWVFVTHTKTHYDPRLVVLLVTLGSVAWGAAGVFGIEYLRDHIKTTDDVGYITSAPLLGVIRVDPRLEDENFFDDPQTPSDESYQPIIRKLLSGVSSEEGFTVMVCSPQATAQVAAVCANVAAETARSGYPAMIVDADRLNSDLTKSLNLGDTAGFAEALLNPRVDVPVHVIPGLPNLHVLPAGVHSLSQPLAFVATRLREMLKPTHGHRSLVVVAGPTVSAQPHWLALELAKAVDKVVLVVIADSTKRGALRSAVLALHETHAKPGGVIFVERKASRRRGKEQTVTPSVLRPAEAGMFQLNISSSPPSILVSQPSQVVQMDLPDLDSLGSESSLEESNTAQDLDLSGLDRLGGELVHGTPRDKPKDADPPKLTERGTKPEEPKPRDSELPEPIPITSARRNNPAISPASLSAFLGAEATALEVQPKEEAQSLDSVAPATAASLLTPVEKPRATELVVSQPALVVSSDGPAPTVITVPMSQLTSEPVLPAKPRPWPSASAGIKPAQVADHNPPPRMIALGAKVIAALSMSRSRDASSVTRQEVEGNLFTRMGLGLQFAIARAVRSITGRGSVVEVTDQVLPKPANTNSLPTASGFPVIRGVTDADQKLLALWLTAAAQSLIRGDVKETKTLLDKVLDRDPHNEAAWELRLRLAEPSIAQTAIYVTTSRRGSKARNAWLAVLLLLVLAGAGGYFARAKISSLVSSLGTTAASPALSGGSPATAVTPALTPTALTLEVSAPFLNLWTSNRQIFGEPISPLITETGSDGNGVTVQYFSRVRLELRPSNNGAEFDVVVGRLGTEVTPSGSITNPLPEGLRGNQATFKENGIGTPQKFKVFWDRNGGSAIFGSPITPVLYETTQDGKRLAVQYFERARFEYHPEYAGTDAEVQLSDLGAQVFQQKHGGK